MLKIAGLDIGGTHIRGSLFSKDGKLLDRLDIATTPKNDTKRLIEKIQYVVSSLEKEAVTIGVGVAGPIDIRTGECHPPNIKGLRGVRLRKVLKTKLPLHIENDVNCFLYSESILGVGKRYSNILGLTLGTGVGGAIVIDKRLYTGMRGSAGEFGHMMVDASKRLTLENAASGTAIEKNYKKLTGKKAMASDIVKMKTKYARKVQKDASTYIGIGIANLLNIFNPDCIILGGSVANSYYLFEKEVKNQVEKIAKDPNKKAKILIHKLKHPGSLGAALLGFENRKK